MVFDYIFPLIPPILQNVYHSLVIPNMLFGGEGFSNIFLLSPLHYHFNWDGIPVNFRFKSEPSLYIKSSKKCLWHY